MPWRYTGTIPVLLMHHGDVWEVHPGDTLDGPDTLDHPQFERVRPKPAAKEAST